jgi:hypothetical protein
MIRQSYQTLWGPDHYVLLETDELRSMSTQVSGNRQRDAWTGGSFHDLVRCIDQGDMSLVQRSDQILNQLEDQVPVSRGWRNIDDVVGSVPNVPAFLAGHPQHMRRRHRVARDSAPLTLFLDLTSSAGINHKDVMQRGIVMLALTRLLVEHRPVTLWAGIAQDVGSGAGTVAWRIETTPIDLARAAYYISSPNMARRFGYGLNKVFNKSGGHWPFRSCELQIKTGKQRLEKVFGTEVLFVPPIYLTDPMIKDPVSWLKGVMSQYIEGEKQ